MNQKSNFWQIKLKKLKFQVWNHQNQVICRPEFHERTKHKHPNIPVPYGPNIKIIAESYTNLYQISEILKNYTFWVLKI